MLTIVFDLDGTLIDTAPDLISTLNFVLGHEKLPPVPYDAARRLIGGGAKVMLERALAEEGRACSATELGRMYEIFLAHYESHIADGSRPFPHVEEVLEGLAEDGNCLAVCTNKLERLSVRLLDSLNLSRHFAAICGQDTFGVQKPDPRMLRLTIDRAGGQTARTVMVGDSGTDISAARAAEVPVVAVNFGYSEVPIASLNPDRVIGSFADLPIAIQEVNAARPPTPPPA